MTLAPRIALGPKSMFTSARTARWAARARRRGLFFGLPEAFWDASNEAPLWARIEARDESAPGVTHGTRALRALRGTTEGAGAMADTARVAMATRVGGRIVGDVIFSARSNHYRRRILAVPRNRDALFAAHGGRRRVDRDPGWFRWRFRRTDLIRPHHTSSQRGVRSKRGGFFTAPAGR